MPLSQTVLLCDTLNNICSSMDSCLIYGDFNLAGIGNRVDYNIIYTNEFDNADCLSEQFSSVFLK